MEKWYVKNAGERSWKRLPQMGVSWRKLLSSCWGLTSYRAGNVSPPMGRRNGHPRQFHSVPIFTDFFLLISLSISSPFQLFILSFFQATHYSLWYINTMTHYSAIARNEIGSFAGTWRDLGSVTQSEISQKKRKTNIMWYHMRMEYRRGIQMNLFSGQE